MATRLRSSDERPASQFVLRHDDDDRTPIDDEHSDAMESNSAALEFVLDHPRDFR